MVGAVLVLLCVGLTLVLAVAGVCTFNQTFSRRLEGHDRARNLAEAAISQGLARVQDNLDWGKAGRPGQEIELEDGRGGSGYLSFNARGAARHGVPFSSNHFQDDTSSPGSGGRMVPPLSAHLVGLGKSGSSRCLVEALVYRPPYSEGIAAANKVDAEGLLLAGLRDPSSFAGDYGNVASSNKMAGHIFANDGSRTSVVLENGSDVQGNTGSRGGIRVRNSRVRGEVRPFSPPRILPRLQIRRIVQDMRAVQGSWHWTGPCASPARGGGNGTAARPWSGYRVIDGDLDVADDLVLDGAAVYVTGNVHIHGSLSGTGMLMAAGSATVDRGAALDPKFNLALCAGGDLTLRGANKDSAYFQGLVYAEGDVTASNISILGSILARGRDDDHSKGNIVVRQVNVYPTPRQVSNILGAPCDPMRIREHPPGGGGPGDFDALSVRVDASEKRGGEKLYNAYLYYAKDVHWAGPHSPAGWTGNAFYFRAHKPGYDDSSPETEPIVLEGLTRDELTDRLDAVVAEITADNPTLRLFGPAGPGEVMAPAAIASAIRTQIDDVTEARGTHINLNLNKTLPAAERFRILLLREMQP